MKTRQAAYHGLKAAVACTDVEDYRRILFSFTTKPIDKSVASQIVSSRFVNIENFQAETERRAKEDTRRAPRAGLSGQKPFDFATPCSGSHIMLVSGSTMCCPCNAVVYCSEMCQQDDWPNHKYICAHRKKLKQK